MAYMIDGIKTSGNIEAFISASIFFSPFVLFYFLKVPVWVSAIYTFIIFYVLLIIVTNYRMREKIKQNSETFI